MSEKSYDRIKNFSTSISVEKTITEIEKMLSKYGANRVIKEYGPNGQPNCMMFTIKVNQNDVPIKLPADIDKVHEVFKIQVSNKKLPNKYWEGEWANEQAARVGWRIIKDWLYAQLSLLQINMVKIEEIFLPYMYDYKSGKTMFQLMEKRDFNLALDYKEEKIDEVPHESD